MKPEGEHPDRVLWYRALLEEWAGQTPGATMMGEWAVAWVESYCSAAGVWHMPTEFCASTGEQALEGLANAVYTALQEDEQRTAWAEAVLAYGQEARGER